MQSGFDLSLLSDNWFVSNVTGTIPPPRELHAMAATSNENAFIFGGWGLLDEQRNMNAGAFLNDLFEIRTSKMHACILFVVSLITITFFHFQMLATD
jgi:hypothetical protein